MRKQIQISDLKEANQILGSMSAEDRILCSGELFGQKAVLLSSMQKTASVLMHMFFKLKLQNEGLFVDTGFHFHETLALRDRFMRDYGLKIITLYPAQTPEEQEEKFGVKLYRTSDGQPVCCDIRKGRPFVYYMKNQGHKLVMGGLRWTDGGARKLIDYMSDDPRFSGYKLNPVLDWTDDQIDKYLHEHNVPVHPLHNVCYPSIGCQCCTTPVMPGEDCRAGRWRHLREDGEQAPAYCSINFSDGTGI